MSQENVEVVRMAVVVMARPPSVTVQVRHG